MAIIKKVIKNVSTVIGELLVVGGALGTTYVLGFIKGSEAKPKLEKTIDDVTEVIKSKVKTEEEPVAEESEPESEAEESPAQEIEVTHNDQAED